jgi:hypothetical protein
MLPQRFEKKSPILPPYKIAVRFLEHRAPTVFSSIYCRIVILIF